MRLRVTKSKNTYIFYVIKTVYIKGKEKTIIVEKLGNTSTIKSRTNGENPYIWAKKYVEELNKQEKENKRNITLEKSPSTIISLNKQKLFNIGYYF